MFKFNGRSSENFSVIEREETFKAKAMMRTEIIEIEGRDGAIYNELGYADVSRTLDLQILDPTKIDAILSWLSGSGTLEFDGKVTTARFDEINAPYREASIFISSVTFIRSPFWTKATDFFQTITDKVFNEGTVVARPIIRLEKQTTDSLDITIGGVRFTYTFPEGETYVEIDCESMTETYEGVSRSRQISIGYDYPLLQVGSSAVTLHSGDPIIKVKRKDRWL